MVLDQAQAHSISWIVVSWTSERKELEVSQMWEAFLVSGNFGGGKALNTSGPFYSKDRTGIGAVVRK